MWQVYSTRSHKTRQSSLWSSQPPRNSSRHRQPLWAKWRMQRANMLSTPTQSVSFCQANPNLNLVGVTNWQFKFAIHFSANIDWKLGVLNVLTLADVTPRRKYESHMFFFWTDALELRLEAGLVFGGVGVAANCDGDFDRSRLPPPSVDQTANCRTLHGDQNGFAHAAFPPAVYLCPRFWTLINLKSVACKHPPFPAWRGLSFWMLWKSSCLSKIDWPETQIPNYWNLAAECHLCGPRWW